MSSRHAKLALPRSLQASDSHLARSLQLSGTDSLKWLLLADRLQLKRLGGQSVQPVVKGMLQAMDPADSKASLVAVSGLSQHSMQMVIEALFIAGDRYAGREEHWDGCIADHVPDMVDWKAPGDML